MTKDQDFKHAVRERAAETGESYQTAWRSLHTERALRVSDAWLAAWWRMVEDRAETAKGRPLHMHERAWLANNPLPLEDLQVAALRHPRAKVRREVLTFLDHHVSDASLKVFRQALSDEVPRVRLAALHGLACERCRVGELPVEGVTSDLLGVLSTDTSAKVRYGAVLALAQLCNRDQRVAAALQAAANSDPDRLVRASANAVLDGKPDEITSRKVLRRRGRAAEREAPS